MPSIHQPRPHSTGTPASTSMLKKQHSRLFKKNKTPSKHKRKTAPFTSVSATSVTTSSLLQSIPTTSKRRSSQGQRTPRLATFHQDHLGMKPEDIVTNNTGENESHIELHTDNPISNPWFDPAAIYHDIGPQLSWKYNLPSQAELYLDGFGRPDTSHSFTQEACGETTLFFVLKSGFLDEDSKRNIHSAHALLAHFDKMRSVLSSYDFTWIHNTNEGWSSQQEIPIEKSWAMMSCLLHYNLDVSLLMRYLGNNYVGMCNDLSDQISRLDIN